MIVRFTHSLVGHTVIKPGQVVQMEDGEAKRHIAAGSAVVADEIEVATFKAREKAISEQRARIAKETAKATETR